ncbi:MAG: hypothetical protein KI790_08860 [Cyclobacteriaceae bacterium]|nr:hypothetical protein [Cyclobacteriaceae bacterium HetDA_MAG_MS6]
MDKLLLYTGKDLQDLTMDVWLQNKAQVLRPLAIKWFDQIKSCGHDVQDIFHDGYPIGCVDHAPFAYVNVFSAHVNVGFFYGADLADENGILEGNGKRMRHVKLKPGSEPEDHHISSLIEASYLDIKKRLDKC